jgi:hypothetical protein
MAITIQVGIIPLSSDSTMRKVFALILCMACLTGCADVRQHWADGLGKFWNHSNEQVAKHGPEFAADAAGQAASSAVDNTIDHAVYGNETARERQERNNEEFFGH